MDKKEVIKQAEHFAKKHMETYDSSHDWWHTQRVRDMAVYLAESCRQNVDLLVIELASLLHDVGDEKYLNEGQTQEGLLASFFDMVNISDNQKEAILRIISHLSFKGGHNSDLESPEFKIVQDADRLDAIGAIGIARAFHYGGSKGHEIYNPDVAIRDSMTVEEYRSNNGTTINHFYEKLLIIADNLNTEKAMEIAKKRKKILQDFLDNFHAEIKLSTKTK